MFCTATTGGEVDDDGATAGTTAAPSNGGFRCVSGGGTSTLAVAAAGINMGGLFCNGAEFDCCCCTSIPPDDGGLPAVAVFVPVGKCLAGGGPPCVNTVAGGDCGLLLAVWYIFGATYCG